MPDVDAAGREAVRDGHAIELDPSSADAYHLVGDVIADFDSERALAFFRKSLALDSRFDVNHTAIADALWLP